MKRLRLPLGILLALTLVGAGCTTTPTNQTAFGSDGLSAQDILASTQLADVIAPSNTATTATNTTTNTAAQPLVINLVYHKDQPSTPQNILIPEGAHVVVHVTSDVADTVHLHGYDVLVDAEPNQQATLEFDATQTGRFILDLKNLSLTLGIFQIYQS